eukprot:CAMPEP_0185596056 /NCGR_PEP_ID=MMETSP0434-20130131/80430_1 /TAXON_ID=626734 ORGANISM="Favella taraikaensis, Strain Fe Narragansett Bay" /NCGR_SAMPLE_ID=MMETSP0434 /ASSEMBLY_ACC=CAM_ASM_000379 /LENGTH=87 /DNA_ID=CAMNT_0028224471 /DNA_START=89 /DNA_END=353 /DNA_ORIENTATION=-
MRWWEAIGAEKALLKDFFPGYYDLSTGGVVGATDQDDDWSAARELEEELGISTGNDRLEKVKVVKWQDDVGKVFANVYVVRDFDPDV